MTIDKDKRPNPPRYDEREAYPLGQIRNGFLDGQGLQYASYGLWVGEFRRYQRIQWRPGYLSPDELEAWTENLATDTYSGVVAFVEKQLTRFRA